MSTMVPPNMRDGLYCFFCGTDKNEELVGNINGVLDAWDMREVYEDAPN